MEQALSTQSPSYGDADPLQQDAAALDEECRQRFLAAVRLYRDLVATYCAALLAVAAKHENATDQQGH